MSITVSTDPAVVAYWFPQEFGGHTHYLLRTDRQTVRFFDTIYRGVYFFLKLNLLPPYSLCTQGDKKIVVIFDFGALIFF